jgi:hypothetical protein
MQHDIGSIASVWKEHIIVASLRTKREEAAIHTSIFFSFSFKPY